MLQFIKGRFLNIAGSAYQTFHAQIDLMASHDNPIFIQYLPLF